MTSGWGKRPLTNSGNRSVIKLFLLFLVINFTLYALFSWKVVAPQLNQSLDSLREADLQRLASASALEFDRYFSDRVQLVNDLAKLPYVINAVRLGGRVDADLVDYFANLNLLGQKPEVALIDISQDLFFSTSPFDISPKSFQPGWFKSLLAGVSTVEMRLFPGDKGQFRYLVAVPVKYEAYIEGVMLVLLQGDLANFSSAGADGGVQLKLCEMSNCVQQSSALSTGMRWISQPLALPGVFLEVMIDQQATQAAYREVSSRTMSILLMTALGAFVLFVILGYPILLRPHQALKEQADKLRLLGAVMENAVEGVAHLDEQGRFNFTNEAFNNFCGYQSEALQGYSWRKVVHPDDWPKVEAALIRLKKQDKVSLEVMGLQSGGQSFHQALTLVKPPEKGGELSIGAFCFLKDISHRKKYEMKLQRANEELSSFAYRTSHDLRAPLMSVKGLLELAGRTIQQGRLVVAREAIDKSLTALARLDHTVEDVLNLTRMDHLESDIIEVRLDALVDEILQQFCQMENFRSIRFDMDLKHTGQVLTEEARLVQMASNLLSNAIKYADMGEVEPTIRIATRSHGRWLEFTVEDNGIGIPVQARDMVFGMFRRFHTQKSYGSGLGLYLVRKNAEALGGRVEYQPMAKGTRFVLSIPQKIEDA